MKANSFSCVISNADEHVEALDLYSAALAFREYMVLSDMSTIGLLPDMNITRGAARALEFMAPDEFIATC